MLINTFENDDLSLRSVGRFLFESSLKEIYQGRRKDSIEFIYLRQNKVLKPMYDFNEILLYLGYNQYADINIRLGNGTRIVSGNEFCYMHNVETWNITNTNIDITINLGTTINPEIEEIEIVHSGIMHIFSIRKNIFIIFKPKHNLIKIKEKHD